MAGRHAPLPGQGARDRERLIDERTVAVYSDGARDYLERRRTYAPEAARAFEAAVPTGAARIDLGCGPGHYAPLLGHPVIALDAAFAMLAVVPELAEDALRVQADLEALPFRNQALGGGWASKSYQHLPHERLPLALADLHRSLTVGAPVRLALFSGDGATVTGDDDQFPGRYFAWWDPDHLVEVVDGAGFDVDRFEVEDDHIRVAATRTRTLPDVVGPGLRVLVCGLNPSLYAADAGLGFARPGNRFWPAALAAGLVTRTHDPRHALRHHAVGMTDLVKRASVGADEVTAEEYQAGVERIRRLCTWLGPKVLCVLGVSGWRTVVDRRATLGLQPEPLGGARVYLMPNPSGRNAHTDVAELASHLRAAAALA